MVETDPPELPAAPAAVAELCDACVRFVKEALKLELDYTQDTLPILDHYLKSLARDAEEEVVGLSATAAGAYFGEVVRRELGSARWYCEGDDHRHWRLEFGRVFMHFNPLGVAYEVIDESDSAGWGAHFQVLDEAATAVESALEHAGTMEPADYYSLSVRFETAEQVVSVLAGLEALTGKPPRSFGPEVYRAVAADVVAAAASGDKGLPN